MHTFKLLDLPVFVIARRGGDTVNVWLSGLPYFAMTTTDVSDTLLG